MSSLEVKTANEIGTYEWEDFRRSENTARALLRKSRDHLAAAIRIRRFNVKRNHARLALLDDVIQQLAEPLNPSD